MSRVDPEALAYQTPLAQAREEPLPWLLRLWPFGAAALLVALTTLAAFAPVDVVVTAEGRIAGEGPPVVLKPMGAAVLRELLVRPGEVVVAGQVLARLDSQAPDTDAAVLRAQARALQARMARIEADLAGRTVAGGTRDLDLQVRIQSERGTTEAAHRAELSADLARIEGSIRAAQVEQPALAETLAAARELEAMRAQLLSKQNGTRLAQVEARLTRLAAEANARQNDARLSSLRQERGMAAARLAAFEGDLRQKQLEELADLRPRLAMIEQQLAQAAALVRLYALTAPQAGVVLSVAAGGPGSLMTAGEPVVVIAPTDGLLHAEIGLMSRDVGLVQPGDAVWIKVDAFPWRRNGRIAGRLADVAPSSSVPPTGGPALHAARVTLDADAPRPEGLMPGMTLTSDIAAGQRTLLSYFLDPLLDGLSESLREPRS